jgi:hypothetical protein
MLHAKQERNQEHFPRIFFRTNSASVNQKIDLPLRPLKPTACLAG